MKNSQLIDKLNDVFITIAAQEKNEQYATYLKSINREIIANIDTLDSAKVKSIVMSKKFDIKDSVLLFAILNAITLILNNRKLTKKEKTNLAPVLAIIAIYSLNKPKQFANRIMTVNRTPSTKLVGKELKLKKLLNQYYKENEKAITKSIKQSEDDLVRSNRKYANNTTKRIRKDINKLLNQNKSLNTIEKSIKQKYAVKTSVVQRNLDTELHAQVETVKLEMSKQAGYTHKTWKTQGDSKVRKTGFHKKVSNQRVPIDSDFVAGGHRASRAGDPRLPAGERIRCRCYIIYD